ncbi:MAG: hypothetical protein ACRCT7_09525 [Shewanella sp.]
MRTLLIVSMALLVSACGMRDIHTINGTTQANNLTDIDQDGVIDARERCKDTTKGAAIDNFGCGKMAEDTTAEMKWTIFSVDDEDDLEAVELAEPIEAAEAVETDEVKKE